MGLVLLFIFWRVLSQVFGSRMGEQLMVSFIQKMKA
jgi:hypothetical protein